jgi:WYL domain
MADYDKSIDTFDRRLLILGMFKGREPLTAKVICDRLGYTGDAITERSVQRGLEMLVTGHYLEVVNPGSKPLQWRWSKTRKAMTLPRLPDHEVLALRLLEQFLKPMLPPDFYRALLPYFENAQQALQEMSAFAVLPDWEHKVRIIPPMQLLLPPQAPGMTNEMTKEQWQGEQQKIRNAIMDALFRNRRCEIDYQQLWRDEPAHWTIHPLVYLQRGPAFYLLCTIDDFTDVRQLALHRMRSAIVLDHKSRRPEGFDVDQEVERSQGMGGSNEPILLILRFYRPAGSHLLETRLAADQTVIDEDDWHFRLTATVNDTAQLRWWLLSFGSKVEVLEPEGLREEMKQNAYWMNRKYSRLPPASASTPDESDPL